MHSPLIIDVAGFKLTTAERQRLAHPLVGGVILFGRNWQGRDQLTALCRQIKSVRPDLLIAVDHEGGRVQRFRTDGFTHLPPMAALGAMWGAPEKKKEMPGTSAMRASRAATATGYVLGAELRACGVDLSFTPVLDLDHGDSSVIGDRSFHRDPRVVVYAGAGADAGAAAKRHGQLRQTFPGPRLCEGRFACGDSGGQAQSEKDPARRCSPIWLAVGRADRGDACACDLPQGGCRVPPGFLERWLQDVLRRQLGFTGAIFSDDLSMEAARHIDGQQVSFTEAALAALGAGADMVLLCNQSVVDDGAPIDEAIDALSRAVLEGQWALNPASEERRLALLPRDRAMDWDSLDGQRALHARAVAAALRVAEQSVGERPSAGPPQARSAPLGGSDPRSGGAWGQSTERRAAPSQGQPPWGAATRAAAERGGDRPKRRAAPSEVSPLGGQRPAQRRSVGAYLSTPMRSSRSDTSSSRSTGLSSVISRCLSSVSTGNSSSQRLATQPLSSQW